MPPLISSRFPYIPLEIILPRKSGRFEGLLDTGFEGEVVVPEGFAADAGPADEYRIIRLADGSEVLTEVHFGEVDLDALGRFPVRVVALGDECLVGLGLANRFAITLDHGRRLIVEP